MNRMLYTARALTLVVALALILAGCTGSPTAAVQQPTQDLSAVRTEAAKTVVAKITIEAALNPTATTAPTQAPQTVVITATPEAVEPASAATSTPLPALPPTATVRPSTSGGTSGGTTSGGSTGGGSVIYPTRTPLGPDAAQYISNTPLDGTVKKAGESFDGVWTVKNIGTRTWTSEYYIRYAGKNYNLGTKKMFTLHGNVKPGETTNLIADMVAPSSAGRYISYWELCNDNDEVFGHFYIVIDVK